MNLSSDVEAFYAHLDACDECHQGRTFGEGDDPPFHFCEIGEALLFEAGEDLPEHWQYEARLIHERQQLQKEADANFEYYKGVDEP